MSPDRTNGRTSLTPAPLGNRRAERHGAYVARFTPTELKEIGQIEDKLREFTPLDSEALAPTFSVLAGQLWRRDRLLADLARHGVVRGRADRGRVAPAVVALTELERAIVRNLDALAMLPKAAADLGLTLARTPGGWGRRLRSRAADDQRAAATRGAAYESGDPECLVLIA